MWIKPEREEAIDYVNNRVKKGGGLFALYIYGRSSKHPFPEGYSFTPHVHHKYYILNKLP